MVLKVKVWLPSFVLMVKLFLHHLKSSIVSGIRSLIEHIQAIDGESRIVMEHTGRYYEPIVRELSQADLFVSAVNPKLIKDFGDNSLRKVKSDKADALKIARYTLDSWTELI